LFEGCISLTSVTLPAGLTSIDEGAFGDCNDLTSVVFEGNDVAIYDEASFPNISLKEAYEDGAAGGNNGVAGAYTRDEAGYWKGSWVRE
jgi:hypothetical protein